MPSGKSLRVREKLGRSRTARGELSRDWDGHVPPWDGHVPSQQEGDRREHRNEDQELRRPPDEAGCTWQVQGDQVLALWRGGVLFRLWV